MALDTLLVFALLGLVSVPLIIALGRANELFVLDFAKGKPTLRRGKIPRRLLRELRDVAERAPVLESATLRATVEDNRPMLRAKGAIDDARLQRMRNVIGLWSKDQIRAGMRKDQLD